MRRLPPCSDISPARMVHWPPPREENDDVVPEREVVEAPTPDPAPAVSSAQSNFEQCVENGGVGLNACYTSLCTNDPGQCGYQCSGNRCVDVAGRGYRAITVTPPPGVANQGGGGQQQREQGEEGRIVDAAETSSSPLALLEKEYRDRAGHQCVQETEKATTCCQPGGRCLLPGVGADANSGTMGVLSFLMGTAASLPASGISQMCGRGKKIGDMVTMLNAGLAAQCQKAIGVCKKSCGNLARRGRELFNECEGRSDCNTKIERAAYLRDSLQDMGEDCGALSNYSMEMTKQAIGSQVAAKFMDICKDQTQDTTVQNDDFNSDCTTAANMNTPFCQFQCHKPEFMNTTQCQQIIGSGPGGDLNGNGNGLTNAPTDMLGGLDGLNADDKQAPFLPDVGSNPNRVSKPDGGGGGSALPGAGSAGGGGGGGQGYDNGSGGYNTSIDKGTRSGNGYSVVPMGTSGGGGFSGYGRGSGAAQENGKPFNLRDFLPGGTRDPKRGIAGLAPGLNKEIGPAHDDIFQRISTRFYKLCLEDRLYDCHTLKKRGPR